MFVEKMRVSSSFYLDPESGEYRLGDEYIALDECPGKTKLMILIDFYDVDPDKKNSFNVMLFDPDHQVHGGWTDQSISVEKGQNSVTVMIAQEGLVLQKMGRYRFVVIEGELKQGYGEYEPLYMKDIMVTTPEQIQQHHHAHKCC